MGSNKWGVTTFLDLLPCSCSYRPSCSWLSLLPVCTNCHMQVPICQDLQGLLHRAASNQAVSSLHHCKQFFLPRCLSRSLWMAARCSNMPTGVPPGRCNLTSSAELLRAHSIAFFRLLIVTLNEICLRLDPCSTPLLTSFQVEKEQLATIL